MVLLSLLAKGLAPLISDNAHEFLQLRLVELPARQVADLQPCLGHKQVRRVLQRLLLRHVHPLTGLHHRLGNQVLVDPCVLVQQAFLGHAEVSLVFLLLVSLLLGLLGLLDVASLFFADLLLDNQAAAVELYLALQQSQAANETVLRLVLESEVPPLLVKIILNLRR